jgi:hypothetical protein
MTRLTRLTTIGFLLSFTGLVGLIFCLVAIHRIDQRRTWIRRPKGDGWAVAGVVIASLSMLVTCGIVGDHCG